MNYWQGLLDMVWAFRREMQHVWPTPDTEIDSLRYADCEAREALDAWMRINRPDHKRNHERDADILGELADCALMLLTALGPTYQFQYVSYVSDVIPTIDDICWYVARAHRLIEREGDEWYYDAESALAAIDAYPGMDLTKQLYIRMSRLRKKHLDRAVQVCQEISRNVVPHA